jgi:hypothetical protein
LEKRWLPHRDKTMSLTLQAKQRSIINHNILRMLVGCKQCLFSEVLEAIYSYSSFFGPIRTYTPQCHVCLSLCLCLDLVLCFAFAFAFAFVFVFVFLSLSFCLFVFCLLSFCLFVFLSFCLFVFLSFCLCHSSWACIPRHLSP